MADIWSNLYDALAAPARERKAREDAMKNAPTFADVLGMTVTSGTEPIGKTDRYSTAPTKLRVSPRSPDQIMPMTTRRWTPDSFAPSMTPAERVALSRQLESSMVNAFPNPAGPVTIQVNGGSKPAYAPWGATSRSLAYNALNTPKAMPSDPMTVEAQRVAKDWIGNPRDFKGRDKGNAALGEYGGSNDVSAKRKPGYKLGDGLLALLTQNNEQPINGLSGLLASLFQQPSTAFGTKLDTRGPSPADRYATTNAVAQLNAILAPRTGNAGGYSYVNGQKTGYAPISAGGASITPTNGAQAYSLANEAGKIRAIANSAEPSKAAARASLASQWGFD